MKWQWLHRAGQGKLLLFCNGWGMDGRVVSHLQPKDFDLLMLYDYSSLTLPEEVQTALERAERRFLLGWSMGVWVGSQVLGDYAFEAAVALNGTLCPIHDVFGIPSAIVEGTLEHFDQTRRQKFYQRMCDRKALPFFLQHTPQRTVEGQQAELAFFREFRHEMAQPPKTSSPWQQVGIASRDLVVLTANQRAFWEGRLPVTTMTGGHYPFTHFPCWADYLAL